MQRSILNTLEAVITAARRTIKKKLVKLDKNYQETALQNKGSGELSSPENQPDNQRRCKAK